MIVLICCCTPKWSCASSIRTMKEYASALLALRGTYRWHTAPVSGGMPILYHRAGILPTALSTVNTISESVAIIDRRNCAITFIFVPLSFAYPAWSQTSRLFSDLFHAKKKASYIRVSCVAGYHKHPSFRAAQCSFLRELVDPGSFAPLGFPNFTFDT